MGTYIFARLEKKVDDKYIEVVLDKRIFDIQFYGFFGWLADVRNYSAVKPITKDRGLPSDISSSLTYLKEDEYGYTNNFGFGWVTVDELLSINYDEIIEDRRLNGKTLDIGQGEKMTLREFLGEWFFKDLEILKENKIDRVIFWFD